MDIVTLALAKKYADEKVSNVKVDLTGYAKEDYVDAEIEELNKKIVQETGKLSQEVDEKLSDLINKANIIVNTKSGETIIATDSSDAKFRGMNVYGKSVQSDLPSPEYPQGIKNCENTEISVLGKNLLENTGTSETINGVTFTVNADKSVTANGTATDEISYGLTSVLKLPFGSYVVNGCPPNGSGNTYRILIGITKETVKYIPDYGTGSSVFEIDDTVLKSNCTVRISSGTTVSNLVFKPMIRLASITDATYEPYKCQSLVIPNTLCGIPVTDARLATYTDENGQMWCSDEVDYERGVFVQRVREVRLDYFGTIKNSADKNWYDDAISYSYELVPFTSNSVFVSGVIGLCSHFNSYNFSDFYNKKIENGIMNSGEYIVINISKSLDICKTIEEFAQWYSDNNVKIVKVLKEPIETPLTAEQIAAYKALHSNYPTTTILNNNGAGLMVKYGADTKLYIDNKFAELAAQLV